MIEKGNQFRRSQNYCHFYASVINILGKSKKTIGNSSR